ncbi:MAG: flippase-like domain-containing protein [Bacteroidetes bacterium]|nr:flippase-like domain-containing protein [Bacteroidota bacterium]
MKKFFNKIYIKYFITCGLLVWLFLKFDVGKVFAIISGLSVFVYLMVNFIHLVSYIFSALKWKIILRKISYIKLLKLYLIGSYYSMVLPGQIAGEAAKAYILGKDDNEAEKVAVSVIIDKITGIIGLLLLSIAGIFFSKMNLSPKLAYSFSAAVIICIMLLFSLRISVIYHFFYSITNSLMKHFPKFKASIIFLQNILSSWQLYIRKTGLMLLCVSMGVGYQLFAVLIYSTLASSMGIIIPFADWLWIIGFLSIILLLPISIAGIGAREGTLIGILATLGISSEKAMALSLSILGIQIVWAIIGALIEIKR